MSTAETLSTEVRQAHAAAPTIDQYLTSAGVEAQSA